MENISQNLKIDPLQVCREITTFIAEKMAAMEREGILVGLSGGFDSAVVAYLAMRSLGPEKLTLLYMPERDSNPVHKKHAQMIADDLGVHLKIKRLSPTLRAAGAYRSLIIGHVPSRKLRESLVRWGRKLAGLETSENLLAARLRPKAGSLTAKANAYVASKHRMRMVVLYQYAQTHNLMVAGAANKTEALTGTFIQWGCDHCADVMPIIHLYRSQLHPLAEYLGVPEEIRTKAADPDVFPGIHDKGDLLGSFEIADQILWGLEHNFPEETLVNEFGEELFTRIKTLYQHSKYMREVPYTL